tara:strand:- start:273 stop:1349 length:1077 start_codon:yes stop_codon:yes gene_type:complete
MGKSASAPAAPDPAATAAAQGAINEATAETQARLNRVNEIGPYGSSLYSKTDGGDGSSDYTRTTTLDPAQQAILDQQNVITGDLNTLAGDQLGRVSTALADPYSYDGLPSAPTADAAARQQTIDALYGQYASRLDPRFADEQTAQLTSLANQGIAVGSDAYTKAMESFGRTKNDAYTSASNQAVASGGAEQNRLFGLQSNERERAIQEYTAQRNAPLNEVTALMSGTQIQNPTFSAIPQTGIGAADITGPTALAYQGQMQNAANQQSANNAVTSGLFGLAGSGAKGVGMGMAMSDRRVKENISEVGKLDNGLTVYSYRFKDGGPQHIGLMAQDVEKVNPSAVAEFGGIKHVNYSEAVL